jgi:hypothetical protein
MKYLLIYIGTIFLLMGCKKPYEPRSVKDANSFLVVEGVINGNPGAVTTISLSRLRKLSDTSYNIPEFNASVVIEQEAGSMFTLQQRDSGFYSSDNLVLDASKRYRLLINTADGNTYASDFTAMLQTPDIDSVTWEQHNDLMLYVNTHDPLNETHYYRWDYVETWEYHSFYNSEIEYENDTVVYLHTTSNHVCWKSANSTEISLDNTVALSSDVISHTKIGTIPRNSQKGSERYSALVKQYALSQEAYHYWQILQKVSQQLGTLFDVQPSQLQGNIHSLSDPSEPVIGYISASTIPEKRIFVDHHSLTDWKEFDGNYCDILGTAIVQRDIVHYLFSEGYYAPYYFTGLGVVTYTWSECVDCRKLGGTTTKPSFW